jgi:hypothetical protein
MLGEVDSGDARAAWLVAAAALAACGGISTSTGQSGASNGVGGSGGSNASGGSGSGGVSGGPSIDMLVAACTAVCDKGKAAGCDGFEYAECTQSCANESRILVTSFTCGNETLDYIACVTGLAEVCAVLDAEPVSTRCDAGGQAVQACIAQICLDHAMDLPQCG